MRTVHSSHPQDLVIDVSVKAVGADLGVAAEGIVVDQTVDSADQVNPVLRRLLSALQLLNPSLDWSPDTDVLVEVWERDGAVRRLPSHGRMLSFNYVFAAPDPMRIEDLVDEWAGEEHGH